jgi:peptidoglycan biosynthesis protein MviN/MurJ (putative lipid II flippase)
MLHHAVIAWLFTLLVEVPIIARFYAKQWRRMAATCAIATSLTNLSMNVLLPSWATSVLSFLVIGETAALLLEAMVYCLVDRGRCLGQALIASAVANTASFALGLLMAPVLFG